jgi:drug/metabolite transporter (DMT)-like permease
MLFAAMGYFVRLSSRHFRPDTLVLARCVFQATCLLPWVLAGPAYFQFAKASIGFHFVRAAVGITSMLLLYYSLSRLPLGLVGLLSMTSALWAGLWGWVFLKERHTKRNLAFSSLTVLGMAVAVWPGGQSIGWGLSVSGLVAGVASGASIGIGQTLVRQMRQRLGTVEIVFWFGFFGTCLTLPTYVWAPEWPRNLTEGVLLVAVGLSATLAQLLVTYGFRYATAFLGSLCLLLGNLWGVVLGVALLHEVPPVHFWVGLTVAVLGLALRVGGERATITTGK